MDRSTFEDTLLNAFMLFVHGIISREQDGVRVHHIDIHVSTTSQRAGIVVEVSRQANSKLCGLCYIDVDIRTQGVTLQVNVAVEAVALSA